MSIGLPVPTFQNLGVLLALGAQQFQYLRPCARRLHFGLQLALNPKKSKSTSVPRCWFWTVPSIEGSAHLLTVRSGSAEPGTARIKSSLRIEGHHIVSMCSITNSVPRA
jgi:hypothetical protein